ncbi:MAG: T9SS type A sorting domain-containing protein [Bacteroidota bacterium]
MANSFLHLYAQQDTIFIAGGPSNAGLLETEIAANIATKPNAVYKLEAGQLHFTKAPINYDDTLSTLTIVGETGGKKPFLMNLEDNGVTHTSHIVRGNLVLKNIYFVNKEFNNGTLLPIGGGGAASDLGIFNVQGKQQNISVEDCVVEFLGFTFIRADVTDGMSVKFVNNYFRDIFDQNQWWRGRIIYTPALPIDTLIFSNNTVTGAGLPLLQEKAVTLYGFYDHNTFINCHKYVFLNPYGFETYFTNNLFINSDWVGEDINIILSHQDPDPYPHGIVGLDTIEANPDIVVQSRFQIDSATIDPMFGDFSNYKWYAANNVVWNDPMHADYYNGAYNTVGDYPVSFITWFDSNSPHEVENVPSVWVNARTQQLVDDHASIKMDANMYDVMDPGLATPALADTNVVQNLAIWNRSQFRVADETRTPDFTDYLFGDNDQKTFPGVENENDDSNPGINKISDFVEDFTYTSAITSLIDGNPVGALHWWDQAYDLGIAQTEVSEAYQREFPLSIDPALLTQYELKNYPNPFTGITTIEFKLESSQEINLRILDIRGKEIKSLQNGMLYQGTHSFQFDGSELAPGLYLYELSTAEHTLKGKMLLSRP